MMRQSDKARQVRNEPHGIFIGTFASGRTYGMSHDAEAREVRIHWPTVERLAKLEIEPDYAVPDGVQIARVLLAVRDGTFIHLDEPLFCKGQRRA